MLPDFNRLKVFYYVFLHRSVAVASAELNITASAVSQSLNKLERELTVFPLNSAYLIFQRFLSLSEKNTLNLFLP